MEKKYSFDTAAKVYDESRPGYPDAVIDWIIDKTGIRQNCKLLEIGPGTGQATKSFAERGFAVHCVEIGENLGKLLISNMKNYPVTVDICAFENWLAPELLQTSMIYCATAFHWLEEHIKYKKCHEILSDNGHLVPFWNVACDSELPAVRQAYDMLFGFYPEKNHTEKIDIDIIMKKRADEIEKSLLFSLEDTHSYTWKMRTDAQHFLKGFFSQSSFLTLDDEKKRVLRSGITELFEHSEDDIVSEFCTIAFIAKKR